MSGVERVKSAELDGWIDTSTLSSVHVVFIYTAMRQHYLQQWVGIGCCKVEDSHSGGASLGAAKPTIHKPSAMSFAGLTSKAIV